MFLRDKFMIQIMKGERSEPGYYDAIAKKQEGTVRIYSMKFGQKWKTEWPTCYSNK